MSMKLDPQPARSPQPPVADADLIRRIVRRDSTALIELERRHHASLYAQAFGILMESKLAARMGRRATQVRGDAVGRDNQPVTPVTPATRATRATPATHTGEGPATPAKPATPAVPASPSHRPDHAGQGGQGRSNNPRRP